MFSELVPLSPIGFFGLHLKVKPFKTLPLDKTHRLPDTTEFHGGTQITPVSLGWSPKGIAVSLEAAKLDFIEFFFDTRDNKNSLTSTRFCHHFHLTLDPLEIVEKTRFRGLEEREHVDTSLIEITSEKKRLTLFFPKEALHGYQPSQFDRLGFTYHLESPSRAQDLSPSSEDFTLETHPNLWASLKLVN